jgi:hypothetical protein
MLKTTIGSLTLCLAVYCPVAGAYEYPLQFTPNPGYRGLVVAGYEFQVGKDGSPQVVGNCSYYTISGGSGKGGTTKRSYDQTCTWDIYGNLLGVADGAPVVPPALEIKGTETIYATNPAGDFTGSDSKPAEHGFVNTPGAHYKWLTPNTDGVIARGVYTHVVTLKSDGDVPVNITAVTASALHGTVTLTKTDCVGAIKVGSKCSVTLKYDVRAVTSTTDLVYDTVRVDLTSNAGEAHDFIQNFTIVMPGKN